MSGWGYALMSIGMVLFWALVIFAIIALVRSATNSGQHQQTPQPTTPEQTLAERLARGEIDAEEYQHHLDTLRGRETGNGRPLIKP